MANIVALLILCMFISSVMGFSFIISAPETVREGGREAGIVEQVPCKQVVYFLSLFVCSNVFTASLKMAGSKGTERENFFSLLW